MRNAQGPRLLSGRNSSSEWLLECARCMLTELRQVVLSLCIGWILGEHILPPQVGLHLLTGPLGSRDELDAQVRNGTKRIHLTHRQKDVVVEVVGEYGRVV